MSAYYHVEYNEFTQKFDVVLNEEGFLFVESQHSTIEAANRAAAGGNEQLAWQNLAALAA